jgi:hypothetical protein
MLKLISTAVATFVASVSAASEGNPKEYFFEVDTDHFDNSGHSAKF